MDHPQWADHPGEGEHVDHERGDHLSKVAITKIRIDKDQKSNKKEAESKGNSCCCGRTIRLRS